MSFDAIFVGGGLQSCLAVLATLARHPEARLLVLERQARLGGNHTWSFHEGDLSPLMRTCLEPTLEGRWPAYEVAFPGYRRQVPLAYASIASEKLHKRVVAILERSPHAHVRLGADVQSVSDNRVVLGSGEHLDAGFILDARGPAFPLPFPSAFQKFLGLELEVDPPGSTPPLPMLMDARVPQCDGYHFSYVLPLSQGRVLVEDTYFSDNDRLDAEALRARALHYADALGMKTRRILREETGVLPIPLASFCGPPQRPLLGGMAGGWFHPTTGYSLPAAAALAEHISEHFPQPLGAALDALHHRLRRQARFGVLLNQLLFHAYAPSERWRALERFYRLPAATIARFYGMRLSAMDRWRVLVGRPPAGVQLGQAFKQLAFAPR